MKISSRWKLWAASLPIAGSVALATFTSPPFDSGPTMTAPMLWQCWSGLVERTSAVCMAAPLNPTNLIPARTHYGLILAKSTLRQLVDDAWWACPAWGTSPTNRINATNLLALAQLSPDFWTNTPPAGSATSSNGWHGIRRAITNLKWTVTSGAPGTATIGTNTIPTSNHLASASGSYCSVTALETAFTSSIALVTNGFPLYEGRRWSPTTNVFYQGIQIIDQTESGDCDIHIYTTNTWAECYIPANFTNGVDCNLEDVFRVTYTVTNTITDPCDPLFACELPTGSLCARFGPLLFSRCTNSILTNTAYSTEVWLESSATGTCAGAASFTDPFIIGLSGTGWAVASVAVTNGIRPDGSPVFVVDRFATPRVPWAGSTSTNPVAWAVSGALLVKKYSFDF